MSEILTDLPFDLDAAALMSKLRIRPGTEDAETFASMVEVTRQGARPKAIYAVAFIEDKTGETVTLGGIPFASRALSRNLDDVERVFAFVVTCGHELDELLPVQGDLLVDFWRDMLKEAVLESAFSYVCDELQRKHLLPKVAVMHPGSADAVVWPLEQQRQLFALLGDVEGSIGVRLTPSCLMIPNKTVSGILFPTERDFRTCQVCHRDPCPNRQAPFDEAMWAALQEPAVA